MGGALDEMMLTCDGSDVPLLTAQRNQQHNQTGLMFKDRSRVCTFRQDQIRIKAGL